MALFVKDGNVWKESGSGGLSVKDANTWKEVDTGFVKDAGVWKEFYKNSVFWLSKFDNPNASERDCQAVGVDPSGTTAALATSDKNNNVDVAKVDATGALQWAKNISSAFRVIGVAVDSSGNVYLGIGFSGACLLKFNSSGTLQWSRQIAAPISIQNVTDVFIDSSGNIFLHCFLSESPASVLVAKFNSSGTVLSQVSISPRGTSFTSDVYNTKNINLDNSGNLLINGDCTLGTSLRFELALIVNNALNSKILETRNTFAGSTFGVSLLKESSGALISISGDANIAGVRIVRWTSSGAYRSQKQYVVNGGQSPTKAGMDANGNIYIVGRVSATSGYSLAYVIKYNLGALPSSANDTDSSFIEWVRLINVASGISFVQSFAFDLKIVGDGVYVSGEYYTDPSNGFDSFYCKLDTSGKIGTANGITISDGASNFTLTQNTGVNYNTTNQAVITTRSFNVTSFVPTISNSTFSYSTAILP